MAVATVAVVEGWERWQRSVAPVTTGTVAERTRLWAEASAVKSHVESMQRFQAAARAAAVQRQRWRTVGQTTGRRQWLGKRLSNRERESLPPG